MCDPGGLDGGPVPLSPARWLCPRRQASPGLGFPPLRWGPHRSLGEAPRAAGLWEGLSPSVRRGAAGPSCTCRDKPPAAPSRARLPGALLVGRLLPGPARGRCRPPGWRPLREEAPAAATSRRCREPPGRRAGSQPPKVGLPSPEPGTQAHARAPRRWPPGC